MPSYIKKLLLYSTILLSGILYSTCGSENITPQEPLSVDVYWIPDALIDSQEKMLTGLKWGLSYLGARLPADSIDQGIEIIDFETVRLNFEFLGFNENALSAINTIIHELEQTNEFNEKERIDIGRFLMLTLGSSYHYFEIVGLPKNVEGFRSLHSFEGTKIQVVNSSIASTKRLIEIATVNEVTDIAFLSNEGHSDFAGNFETEEFETVDLMSNGQYRFGIYDKNGKHKAAGEPTLTRAGKPTKCMWCHEIVLQPFFRQNPLETSNHALSEEEFLILIKQYMNLVDIYRSGLESALDFTKRQDHTFMEQLYIGFMEPTAERLAAEWNISLEEATERLVNLTTHDHFEFLEYKSLYHRSEVDPLSPYEVIRVPDDPREPGTYEPNLFE